MHAPVGSRVSTAIFAVLSTIMVLLPGGSKLIAQEFIRGDCLNDGRVNIADSIYAWAVVEVPGTPQPQCLEACDLNGNGAVNPTDANGILFRLFNNFVFTVEVWTMRGGPVSPYKLPWKCRGEERHPVIDAKPAPSGQAIFLEYCAGRRVFL